MLVRVFAIVVGLQVSGIGPAAAEVLRGVACESIDTREECPPDQPCDDCPPSCPHCSCASVMLSVVPQVGVAPIGAFIGVRQPREPVARRAPNVPELAGLFRPPCSRAVS